MVKIKPFAGIRPPKELAAEVSSRPYDVLNSQEAKAEATERSLLHIIKPEIDFDPIADEHDEKVYKKAVENFKKWRDNKWLVQDGEEHYYIYAQTMNGRTQYGLAMCCYYEDYWSGKIKKHELTRIEKEEDRMKHVELQQATRRSTTVSPRFSQVFPLCTWLTDTIVPLPLPVWARSVRRATPTIPATRNTAISWPLRSLRASFASSTTTAW